MVEYKVLSHGMYGPFSVVRVVTSEITIAKRDLRSEAEAVAEDLNKFEQDNPSND